MQLFGKPKYLEPFEQVEAKIRTEKQDDKFHAVYFNCGVEGLSWTATLFPSDFIDYYS